MGRMARQNSSSAETLRERKQRRARDAIVGAAYALFAERGFDHVTVADIAERAEVGRATFFRYFGGKQEVVFDGDAQVDAEVVAAARRIPADGPIGGSLPAALAYLRSAVALLIERLTESPEEYRLHERLVAANPDLGARALAKQRRYVDTMTELLDERGAEPATASLAAEVALACFYAGRTAAGNDPDRLAKAVDDAFERVLGDRLGG